MSTPFLIFLRIPKTGSTTLKKIALKKINGKKFVVSDEVYKMYGEKWNQVEAHKRWKRAFEKFKGIKHKYKNNYKCIVGHTFFGVHDSIEDFQYITFLRDPVKRFISLYNYFYDKKGSIIYRYIHEYSLSFAEFIRHNICGKWENQQVKFVAGDFSPDRNTLEKARKNIENDFAFVGLTEHFDGDLLRLSEILNWSIPYYVRRNASKNHISINNISEQDIYEIQRRNKLDMALYRFVKSRRKKCRVFEKTFIDKPTEYMVQVS